jgi:hypothetical protein
MTITVVLEVESVELICSFEPPDSHQIYLFLVYLNPLLDYTDLYD